MNIVEGLSTVSQIMKKCITDEMVEGGLLEEVESFVPSYRMDEPMEEPCIWLFEHETTVVEEGTLSKVIELQTPFEFVCTVYDENSHEESELKGKELAGKVAAAIGKNFNRINLDGHQLSSKPVLETIYPVGTVDVDEKDDYAVATSVRINIRYHVNWVISCRQQKGD